MLHYRNRLGSKGFIIRCQQCNGLGEAVLEINNCEEIQKVLIKCIHCEHEFDFLELLKPVSRRNVIVKC